MNESEQARITFRQLLAFFLPLGFSASLVTISHVIINSTLARSAQPELIIAAYALPMSILGITERPAVLLRQTCSALVRDRQSFRAMSLVGFYVLGSVSLIGLFISYTPVGPWVFLRLFGAEESMIGPMIEVYRVLMFVSIFSGIRCIFHGIIIYNMRTKWLTIGMLIRLVGMYSLSLYFIQTGVTSATVGAILFLSGMMIEAAVSFWEGRSLLRKVIPEKLPEHPIEKPAQIFGFYKPLLYSSFIAVISGPAINAFLGKTTDIQLSIAAFAIAASLTQLVISFFTYVHQLVLNFYRKDPRMVLRFTLMIALIPGVLLAVLSYTPAGPWFMEYVMGVNERLLHASLSTLRVFMIMTLIFPWLDYGNGLLMLHGQTKVMVWSQAANVCTTLLALFLCIALSPAWNGMIGALAQSLGIAAEAAVVWYVIRETFKAQGKIPGPPKPFARNTKELSENV
ncbi:MULTISPECIES: multi antimicrobial extrusion protein MatE [unclassified Paenibacillus]|uniref:multi antimicrobial extrusion protein MatE n=1 Tax=unclassified Paenibacillus TaxID=185978 RepID=UPI001AE4A12C|nr:MULTISPECIES: multi antimicrobial extrusion protein MatE [unclassified Paenibacillus]MBP1154749.1 Na+-driven multidrug efflux pump [Paenibacillus sp. PvP091]MBP1169867.1 Na+-driven multidrug efflux pump [Paenibacillus sp. PvR098]MBP2440895.1 Na+-driven multidrug efflux pump [Paenibacillus sp. PvP052]